MGIWPGLNQIYLPQHSSFTRAPHIVVLAYLLAPGELPILIIDDTTAASNGLLQKKESYITVPYAVRLLHSPHPDPDVEVTSSAMHVR